ncbi:MAG TPA: glycosyltransferase family 9 protein, partial [Candidatus Edwardsbacteria bacterium]|nr:glycosyltransferase family 9 protein [Candidatus Edwardsbacteria bacterium]
MDRRGKNILVVRQDRLGDAINAVAVLKYLRRNLPDARIGFMTAPSLAGLFREQRYADDVVSYDANLFRLAAALRRGRYDAVLMLKPAKALAWASLFAGIGAKAGLGWRPYYPLTGFRSGYPELAADEAHEIDFNLAVAKKLFPGRSGDIVPELTLDDELKQGARRDLADHKLEWPVALLPANRGSSPNWPAEAYAALAEALRLRGVAVAVVGGPGEQELLRRAAGRSQAPQLGPDRSLPQLAALLMQCRAVVASSTGTLHLAAAVGTPTIGLFCAAPASRPQRWAPLGAAHVQLTPHGG